MKVAINWLKELVDLNTPIEEVVRLLNLKTIATKAVTKDYIELDMKGYNRPDLLSLRGVALETAAITESKIKFKDIPETEYIWVGQNLPGINVKIENVTLAPVYCVAKIEGLKVDKSPDAWVKKIEASGFRPINNMADVTNLIMVEYGQPLHAFDADKVSQETLIVRGANSKDTLTTLDRKPRILASHMECGNSDLVIVDPQKVLGLAGVMGGKDSEVSDNTTTILLEAAIFDGKNLRKTAQRLGLQSEAAKRFQHGLTKTRLLQALDAAIRMYQDLGGKLVSLSLVGNLEDQLKIIKLSQEKINSLLGVKIPADLVESSLQSLGFTLASQGDPWEANVPYWRLDIQIEEDLIEEVARMYGYEKIEGTKLPEEKIPPLDQTLPNFIYNLKLKLKEAGLTEVETYSFYSTAILEALEVPKQALIKIANPISSETEYLRNQLWPNLVEVVGKNIRKGYKDIGIFEIGKVYWQEDGQPKENYRLSITLMNGSDNPIEELVQIVSHLRGEKMRLHLGGELKLNPHLFHPKRQIDGMGEVHLRVLNKLGIEKRVAITELQL